MISEAESFIRTYVAPVCQVLFNQDEIPVGLNRESRIAVVQAAIQTGLALSLRGVLRDIDGHLEEIGVTLEETNFRLDAIARNVGSE